LINNQVFPDLLPYNQTRTLVRGFEEKMGVPQQTGGQINPEYNSVAVRVRAGDIAGAFTAAQEYYANRATEKPEEFANASRDLRASLDAQRPLQMRKDLLYPFLASLKSEDLQMTLRRDYQYRALVDLLASVKAH
jgi:hypothetical protein